MHGEIQQSDLVHAWEALFTLIFECVSTETETHQHSEVHHDSMGKLVCGCFASDGSSAPRYFLHEHSTSNFWECRCAQSMQILTVTKFSEMSHAPSQDVCSMVASFERVLVWLSAFQCLAEAAPRQTRTRVPCTFFVLQFFRCV